MDEEQQPRPGHAMALIRTVIDHLVAVALPHPADPTAPDARGLLPDRMPVRGSDPARPEVYLVEFAAGYKRLVRCGCLLRAAGRGVRTRAQAVVDAIPDGPPVLCGAENIRLAPSLV